jgi:hypothetical protein
VQFDGDNSCNDRAMTPAPTVADALAAFFQANGLPSDGGYSDPVFTVKLGPLPLALPNGRGRRRAVRFHDLHHIITGHRTNFRGEAENAAWELGGGCGTYLAAWMLALMALGPGLLCWPRRTWQAFVAGRRSGNLYGVDDQELLNSTIGELRHQLGMDDPQRPEANVSDFVLFAVTCLAAVPVAAGGFLLSLLLMPVAACRRRHTVAPGSPPF